MTTKTESPKYVFVLNRSARPWTARDNSEYLRLRAEKAAERDKVNGPRQAAGIPLLVAEPHEFDDQIRDVVLAPGMSAIDGMNDRLARELADLATLSRGEIEVLDSLASLPVRDALREAARCWSRQGAARWLERETRPDVRKALEERLARPKGAADRGEDGVTRSMDLPGCE